MNEREYRRLKDEAKAEYDRKLDAIEMVWKLSGGTSANGAQNTSVSVGKGLLQKAIRLALEDIPNEFTIRDAEDWIRRNNASLAATLKRPSLSSALKRLAGEGVILLTSTGSGKRPSKYRKVGTSSG